MNKTNVLCKKKRMCVWGGGGGSGVFACEQPVKCVCGCRGRRARVVFV